MNWMSFIGRNNQDYAPIIVSWFLLGTRCLTIGNLALIRMNLRDKQSVAGFTATRNLSELLLRWLMLFIEIKSGPESKLSPEQNRIKHQIKHKRVEWYEFQIR